MDFFLYMKLSFHLEMISDVLVQKFNRYTSESLCNRMGTLLSRMDDIRIRKGHSYAEFKNSLNMNNSTELDIMAKFLCRLIKSFTIVIGI